MRIIVVENEPNTRNGIIRIINTHTAHQVIAGECDGLAGLKKIIKLKPDVVITDINMPIMDGLTMIKKVQEAGIITAAIVLTGYSEFDYAHRAIQLAVVEYLLKPLNIEDIIEVLGNVESKLSIHNEEIVSAEQLLFSILTGEDQQEILRQFSTKIKHQKDQLISMFFIQSESILDDIINQMVHILQDCLDTICLTGFYIFKLPYDKQLLVLITDGQNVRYLKNIFNIQILSVLKEKGNFLISYEEITDLFKLKETIRQMQEYTSYNFLFSECCIIDRQLIKDLVFEKVEYPEQLEHVIKREIRNGNKMGIKKYAQQFEHVVIQRSEDPKIIKHHTVRFIMAMIDTARDLMRNGDIEVIYQYLLNDMLKTSIREIFLNNYQKMVDMIIDDRESDAITDNGMILNVIGYIRQNYDQEILLSDASELVAITPEYLSKLFTKEMGINFSTFLTEFRISKAKKLLATGNYKIYEVAEMVGYKDTKYFNKVFRSIMGVSPSDYRKVF